MNRDENLEKLHAISEPLCLYTGYADGVTCEYITRKGCGFFELIEWSDLDNIDGESADQEWDEMSDDELADWVERLEAGEFSPIKSAGEDNSADSVERDE